MSELHFPVHITAVDAAYVYFNATQDYASCPKCQAGEGCGAYPWFRGFVQNQRQVFSLPVTQAEDAQMLTVNDQAVLILNRQTINMLSLISYGLPLIGFFIGLSATLWHFNETIQLIAGTVGVITGIITAKPVAKRYLWRTITLRKTAVTNAGICMNQSN